MAINDSTMETKTSLNATISPPGTSIAEYMSKGRVCVCPTIFQAKVMVAPNSPRHLAKPSINPLKIPGNDKGMVMVINVFHGPAPNVLAANSSLTSTISMATFIALTTSGNETTMEAKTAAQKVNEIRMSKYSSKNFPTNPLTPNTNSKI